MTQQALDEQAEDTTNRRRQRSAKPFPVTRFEDVQVLPKGVLEHGVSGRIRRTTLFDRLGRSPDSGSSRQLVTDSGKYGLTSGGYNAEYIAITEDATAIFGEDQMPEEAIPKKFNCAIGQFDMFRQTYDNLLSQRLPGNDVLEDLLGQAGVPSSDLSKAASVFVDNLRFLGLIREMSGAERVIPVRQLLEEMPESDQGTSKKGATSTDGAVPEVVPEVPANDRSTLATNRPALHIDIQVHIDPTSSAEQIDQIFASMAKYLYRTEP